MSPKQNLLDKMEAMGVSPKRSLGQNFLVNPNVIEKIIKKVSSFLPSHIVEVGPGLGALTERLIRLDRPLSLIEMDKEFAAYWKKNPNLNVFEADALQFNWSDIKLPPETLFVSNLPYQIAARIVVDRSLDPSNIKYMVLMFQKEVAERLMAKPSTKAYGFPTVIAQNSWKMQKVTDAGSNDFYPAPKVISRVLSFERIGTPSVEFVAFVKKAFENRRKLMLKNFEDSRGVLTEFLTTKGYGQKVRAEQITPEDFWLMFLKWQENVH